MTPRTLLLLTPLSLSLACGQPLPHTAFEAPAPAPIALDAAGPIHHDAVISARWAVPRSGLIDLDDPRAAGLEDGPHPIVLPVHVLTHPTVGTFIIDTGVPAGPSPIRGPILTRFTADLEVVKPLADILADAAAPLAGVLLTHGHLDHVVGLVDVPAGVPIFTGQGEETWHGLNGAVTFGTFQRALGDRSLTQWDFDGPGVVDLDGVPAIDVLGDGSLYALDAHGHTPGSTAYLARTPEGPVLFTGDCSHTRWGWDHGVTPGTYTHDHADNTQSLAALQHLAAAHPTMKVEVGHELAP